MAALASAVIVSAPQVKAYTLSNAESVATNTGLGLSEEKPQAPVRAPQKATGPNYAEDEKNVGFYKETQLERGNGPAFSISEPEMDFLDGFRYSTLEPSGSSTDKKLWGFEIEFDREQGQRTYTSFSFTNSGGLINLLETGNISANDVGVKISENGDFKAPNYKADTDIEITKSGRQINLNAYATEVDLEHINSIDNNNTTMAWKGNYKIDNPNGHKATQGSNASFSFTSQPMAK